MHREPQRRAALLRLAGVAGALAGAPGDRVFDSAPLPDVVLLGAAGDFEAELEFAHRFAPRLRTARWILVCDPMDVAETRRLFDTLPCEVLAYPPDALVLRRRVVEARHARHADRLSERRSRDALAARFARWLGDLDMPELLRALDPQLARVPMLVRGEPGSGRGVLARYVHAFGGMTGGAFVAVACRRLRRLDELAEGISRAAARPAARHGLTICLEDVDQLEPALAHELRSWIEITPPDGVLHTTWLRWMGTAGPSGEPEADDTGLSSALAGILLEIPPLRERPHLVSSLALDAAEAWAEAQGQRARRFSEEALDALREYPWPGNVRELEAVVVRTLAADPSNPLPASALRFSPWPAGVAGARGENGSSDTARWNGARADAGDAVAPLVRNEQNGNPGDPRAVPAQRRETSEPGRPPAPVEATDAEPGEALARRFLAAIAHEIRNPLVPIRTLAGLLPQRFEDAEFRDRFVTQVGHDVDRIAAVLDRMSGFATLGPAQPRAVDVAALLDEILDAHRDEIQSRRLLVLKELERGQPLVQADPEHLRFALSSLVGKALSLMPERGDLYLASKHHASARGAASVRVLLRYHTPRRIRGDAARTGVSLAENTLELVIAETLIRGLGGRLTLDETEADESVLVIDLPA